jgi:hypothetical protein
LEKILAYRFFGNARAQVAIPSAIQQQGEARFAELPREIAAARVLLYRLTTPETPAAD